MCISTKLPVPSFSARIYFDYYTFPSSSETGVRGLVFISVDLNISLALIFHDTFSILRIKI